MKMTHSGSLEFTCQPSGIGNNGSGNKHVRITVPSRFNISRGMFSVVITDFRGKVVCKFTASLRAYNVVKKVKGGGSAHYKQTKIAFPGEFMNSVKIGRRYIATLTPIHDQNQWAPEQVQEASDNAPNIFQFQSKLSRRVIRRNRNGGEQSYMWYYCKIPQGIVEEIGASRLVGVDTFCIVTGNGRSSYINSILRNARQLSPYAILKAKMEAETFKQLVMLSPIPGCHSLPVMKELFNEVQNAFFDELGGKIDSVVQFITDQFRSGVKSAPSIQQKKLGESRLEQYGHRNPEVLSKIIVDNNLDDDLLSLIDDDESWFLFSEAMILIDKVMPSAPSQVRKDFIVGYINKNSPQGSMQP